MRITYLAIGFLLFLFLFLHFANADSTNSNLSRAINYTASYIEIVNESAYLIFYPNLTGSYYYYNQAINASKSNNSSHAYALLHKARDVADVQLAMINRYRTTSLYVLIAITIILGIILYVLMRPYKVVRR